MSTPFHLVQRVRSALLVLTLVGSVLIWQAEPALASNFGATTCSGTDSPFSNPPPNCVSLGNNYTHTYEIVSVRSDIVSSFQAVMSVQYHNGTDLEVFARSPGDVVVMDNNYGFNNAVGFVNCPPSATQGGSGATRWCLGQYLRFNLDYASYYDTTSERQWVSCHEFGHTVGLRDTTDTSSCLNQSTVRIGLNTHDKSQINATYLPY